MTSKTTTSNRSLAARLGVLVGGVLATMACSPQSGNTGGVTQSGMDGEHAQNSPVLACVVCPPGFIERGDGARFVCAAGFTLNCTDFAPGVECGRCDTTDASVNLHACPGGWTNSQHMSVTCQPGSHAVNQAFGGTDCQQCAPDVAAAAAPANGVCELCPAGKVEVGDGMTLTCANGSALDCQNITPTVECGRCIPASPTTIARVDACPRGWTDAHHVTVACQPNWSLLNMTFEGTDCQRCVPGSAGSSMQN